MAMSLRLLDSPHCGRGCVCLVTHLSPFECIGCLLSVTAHMSHTSRSAWIFFFRSDLYDVSDPPPMVLPIHGHLDAVRRLLKGDFYVRRGCRQRGLRRSLYANDYKVSEFGRQTAIERFAEKLSRDSELQENLHTLSGKRLLCHCRPTEACHADSIISAFRDKFPEAFDRDDEEAPAPTAHILAYLALLKTEQEEEEVSSPDEGAAPKHTGWRGTGRPLIIGTGYTEREMCDGMSLASPSRWSPEHRRYPSSRVWSEASKLIMEFSCEHGTPELLASLALGKVKSCPFPAERVEGLKRRTVEVMEKHGLKLFRHPADRPETSIDFRYLSLLLEAADDPDKHLGEFAWGVRVVPGARLPRLPALYEKKTSWRLPEQYNSLDYQEERAAAEGVWRSNYSSLAGLADKVEAVMDDQAERGQILRLTEKEARARFPNLTVASLGANKKEKVDR